MNVFAVVSPLTTAKSNSKLKVTREVKKKKEKSIDKGKKTIWWKIQRPLASNVLIAAPGKKKYLELQYYAEMTNGREAEGFLKGMSKSDE